VRTRSRRGLPLSRKAHESALLSMGHPRHCPSHRHIIAHSRDVTPSGRSGPARCIRFQLLFMIARRSGRRPTTRMVSRKKSGPVPNFAMIASRLCPLKRIDTATSPPDSHGSTQPHSHTNAPSPLHPFSRCVESKAAYDPIPAAGARAEGAACRWSRRPVPKAALAGETSTSRPVGPRSRRRVGLGFNSFLICTPCIQCPPPWRPTRRRRFGAIHA
jgi:hypothetical protein